ncbi:hypothetical protein RJ639_038034 [Escallonia herrerae]|uniref:Serine-threonine/tyrosine-protein kinase catalytic domain-containing protein n=1 Tax=Escallonia herrerae TaxID=1293975 RepID=A0AA88WLJ4_9ASTE|nr:hypothetical protein RJ639_038034 [Escallonia herrerae]
MIVCFAAIIASLLVLARIGEIVGLCVRRMRDGSVLELQAAVAPPASNVVQVWEVDATTMEGVFQDLAREKPVQFTTQQICSFTNNYSTTLGSGGFKVVCKGQFHNGVKIAVKVFKRSLDRTAKEQFMAEIGTIGRMYHINLVSFGMVLFEIVGNRRNAMTGPTDSLNWFPKHVRDQFEKGELRSMTSTRGFGEKDREKAERMCLVALWCVQDSPESRPLMSTVVKMLEGGVEIMPPPKPFQYLVRVGMDVLKPQIDTNSSSVYSSSKEANSYRYKKSTPVMTKYEIQIATS